MISVIMPSYNSESTIQGCLNALLNQSYGGESEIILVDSSVDKTPHIVARNYPRVKLIHLNKKTDPGTARNIGIRESKGEIIAFLDSDCVTKSDWLEKIALAHESSYSVVGGSINIANNENDLVGWAGYLAEFREFLPELPRREVEHIPTCNLSLKRRIVSEYGLFQGEFYPQEDRVYNFYLRQGGEKILFDSSIKIYHYHRSNLVSFLNHQNKIGEITARVLKIIPLEGSVIAKNPALALLCIPFLPLVKFIRTAEVCLKYQPKGIIRRSLVLILFALGLVFWAFGFARGVFLKRHP